MQLKIWKWERKKFENPVHTIRASASPSAIAASLKPPPAKGIAESHCKKISISLVQPVRCTRQPA